MTDADLAHLHLMIRRSGCSICPDPTFGDRLDFPLPKDANLIIVCTNSGRGLEPRRVLLPHQLYVETVAKLLAAFPETLGITVIPARSREYFDVWSADRAMANAATPRHHEDNLP